MKRKIVIPTLLNLAGIPIILMVVGLILIVSPDTASALIARVLGWVLIAYGVFFGISAFMSLRSKRMAMMLYGIICLFLGTWLVRNPLVLAQGIGKFLGVLLGLRGVNGIFDALNVRKRGGSYIVGLVLGALTLAAGLWMMLSPMSPSRFLMTVVGIVFIAVGAANLFHVRGDVKALISGEDSNIVDADA